MVNKITGKLNLVKHVLLTARLKLNRRCSTAIYHYDLKRVRIADIKILTFIADYPLPVSFPVYPLPLRLPPV